MSDFTVNIGRLRSSALLLDNIGSLGLTEGDTVLVKASHGMNFAKLVEKIRSLYAE